MNRVMIVDGDVLAHKAALMAQERVEWDKEEMITEYCDTKRLKSFTDMLLKDWAHRVDATSTIVLLSDPSRTYWRHELYPQYKGHRKREKGPIGMHVARAYLEEKHGAIWERNLEGDDLVGITATDPGLNGVEPVVVSIDKDMRQLGVPVWNPDTSEWMAEVQCSDMFHMRQTLEGDKVDNYPGCPKVGPKTSEPILYGGPLDEVWDRVVAAFVKVGLTEEDALLQARLARILQHGEYDFKKQEVKLWEPAVRVEGR